MSNPLDLETYAYNFDPNLIAKEPIKPPTKAKLLVYKKNSKKIIHLNFQDFIKIIPEQTILIFNDTKVIKARLFGKKETGGKVEILVGKKIKEGFLVFVKGKVKENQKIFLSKGYNAQIKRLLSDGNRVAVFFKESKKLSSISNMLREIGHIPIPPYLKREEKKEDEINYQNPFGKKEGAIAAPTASLHFSKETIEQIKKKFKTYFITLHVGAGTFKPVEERNILKHKMHSEYFYIPKETQKAINSSQNILAIGTTVTRAIEFYTREKITEGECNLFLHPLNPPKRVNFLLTNFHLPKTTLLMLVASFIGIEETKKIYNEAIRKKYRFYSYGDAMLIL
jgi:S-adenosylmethionine:tRNA ribosyltransferase-isomerase